MVVGVLGVVAELLDGFFMERGFFGVGAELLTGFFLTTGFFMMAGFFSKRRASPRNAKAAA